ncbi:hypothetical protein U1Q18_032351 [Sarracenia purpurea var. burkii]
MGSCDDEGRKRAREEDETIRDHNPVKKPNLVTHIDDKLDHTAIKLQKQKQKHHSFDFDLNLNAAVCGYNPGTDDVADDGVFDFPWLKEGVSFEAADGCQLELENNNNIFASYLTLERDEALALPSSCTTASSSSAAEAGRLDDQLIPSVTGEQNLMCQYSPKLLNFHDHHDQDDLPSFQCGELEGVDWICSSVID